MKTTSNNHWPAHRENEVVSIIAEEESGMHRLLLRSDGTLWVGIDADLAAKHAPEYVHAVALPGTLIRREELDAARRLFDKVDKGEAS